MSGAVDQHSDLLQLMGQVRRDGYTMMVRLKEL